MSASTINVANPPKKYLDWVDYAKGFAILGVAGIHQLDHTIAAGIIDDASIAAMLERWYLISFNIPVFFLLAGLFVVRSIERRSGQAFAWEKVRTMVYPYFLWSTITIIVGIVIPTNSARFGPETFVQILYNPIMQFWFLYGMFLLMLVLMLWAKANLNLWGMFGIASLMLITSVVFDAQLTNIVVYKMAQLTIFLMIGVTFGQQIRDFMANVSMPALGGMAVAGAGLWFGFVLFGPESPAPIFRPIFQAFGVVGVVSLSVILDRMRALGIVRMWGHRSLHIYLMFFLIGIAFRIGLDRALGIEIGWLHFFGGTLFAVNVAMFIGWIVEDKLGFQYAFTWPKDGLALFRRPGGQAKAVSS